MSAAEIDAYLADVEEPDRGALETLRLTILALLPEAEQGLSYRVPAFRVDGKVVAGFAGFTKHRPRVRCISRQISRSRSRL